MGLPRSSRGATPARDTDETPFAAILADLLARIPGAFAAALVDLLGETIDYTGRADPFDVKVAAAHWHIVLSQMVTLSSLGKARTLVIRATHKSYLVHVPSDEYAVVVLLGRRAGFTASERALSVCDRALAAEAGWAVHPDTPHWYPVNVHCDGARRPARVTLKGAGSHTDLEVLGSVMGLVGRERGFRVRLSSGAELTLVREAGGVWYADDTVPHVPSRPSLPPSEPPSVRIRRARPPSRPPTKR